MLAEFRDRDKLIIKPESDLEHDLLQGLKNAKITITEASFSSSLEVKIEAQSGEEG